MMTILIFIIVLAVLILAHELGHFLAAKWVGVKVEEFGLGFPPRVKSWQRGETVYSLNALPIGGFVKLLGEDGLEEGSVDRARALNHQKRYWQALILSAGVIANFLVAWLLLSIGLVAGLPMSLSLAPEGSVVSDARVTVVGVQDGSPAAMAGLEVGDVLLRISETDSREAMEVQSITEVQDYITRYPGEELNIEINRDGERKMVTAAPTLNSELGRAILGFQMDQIGIVNVSWWQAPWSALKLSVLVVVGTLDALGNLLQSLFVGTDSRLEIAGPVGLAILVGDAARLGWAYLLSFVAVISLNLAILNILPLPALDGGRLLVLGVEAVLRRNLPQRIVMGINATGFILLLLLMVAVTYFDLLRILGSN